MNPLIRSKYATVLAVLISPAIALAALTFSPQALAVFPPPDGGYPGGNTAEGDFALFSLSTGVANTAIGSSALLNNSSGSLNTAVGFSALLKNQTGFHNTATGMEALVDNTTGFDNTATGFLALSHNITGSRNTAIGVNALLSNADGGGNTATGANALFRNISGAGNTATGDTALSENTSGFGNTAMGLQALSGNQTGVDNTAIGWQSLFGNVSGTLNTAVGVFALSSNNGNNNIALGASAGVKLTSGAYNIDIGNVGVAGDSKTIRVGTEKIQTATFVAGITATPVVAAATVVISATGQLGVPGSSARFKEAIKPMDKASEAILSLRPVTFRYKRELDPNAVPQFGLVAEEVAKVNPDLVALDASGRPYTVRYAEVNAMLLNEFLKEHRSVQDLKSTVGKQEAMIAQQQEEIQALTAALKAQKAQIQEVSHRIEAQAPASRVVAND